MSSSPLSEPYQTSSLFELSPDADQTPVATTWTVAELHRVVNGLLNDYFGGEIWVEGEIRNLNRSKNGHVYFDLIDSERADDSYPPMIAVTLFDRDRQVVNRFLREQGGNVRINDGVRVRIRGRVGTFAARSTLQLRMTGIDPKFTLGVLEMMRQQVLAALAAENLLDRNSRTVLAAFPARVALVTSLGSAAHADALHEFDGAGIGIELFLFDARVQGGNAGRSLAAAIGAADAHGVDVILLVRGGGARTDLAAFDLEVVARAIAAARVPVFTGIGHEVDSSIADRVAHSSYKTPTAAAAALCELVHGANTLVEEIWAAFLGSCLERIARLDTGLEVSTARLARSSTRHLNRRDSEVMAAVHGVRMCTRSALDTTASRLSDFTRRLSSAPERSLDSREMKLENFAALARAHDPRRALARGWSITRTADGNVVRSLGEVGAGDVLTTEFTDGVIRSVVDSTHPIQQERAAGAEQRPVRDRTDNQDTTR